MKRSLALLSGVFLLAYASAAHAQILFSNPVAITTTDGSQISTAGTFVDAVAADGSGNADTNGFSYSGASIKIGDTTFDPLFPSGGGVGDSVITFSSNVGGGNDGSHSDATPFLTALDGVVYTGDFNPDDTSIATVTLHDLNVGNVYQVQVFQDGGFKTDVTGANTATDLTGAYTLGTFTATGATQTFTFSNDGADGSGIGAVDAIVLRDVPEPSTYLLIGLGLFACFAMARFRKLSA